jgi:hypothetical protein
LPQAGTRSSIASTLASLLSLAAALTCCLPLGTLLMAAGSAGASLFSEKLRPWLLAFSVASLLFAFVQTYLRARCDFRYRRARTVLLWLSAVLVIGMLAAPRYFSSLIAGELPAFSPGGELHTFVDADFLRRFAESRDFTRVVVLLSPT